MTSARPAHIVALAASLRARSINGRLADVAATRCAQAGAEVAREDYRALVDGTPAYDQDVEDADGIPPVAAAFAARLAAADGLLLAAPEFSHSMPGILKNLFDWVSRVKPLPTPNLVCFLLSASPSMVGGYRGLQALRIPLETLGVIVLPDMFALAQAKTPEDVDRLTGTTPAGPRLSAGCAAFVETALAMRPIADRRR